MSTAAGRVSQRAPAKPARKGSVPKPAGPRHGGSSTSGASRRGAATPGPRQRTASIATKRVAVPRSTVVFVVITGAVVVAIMLGLVALNALLAQTSFRIGDLQARVKQLTQSYEQRRLEAAQVSSPAHLAKVAEQQGLVVPQGGIIILAPPPADTTQSSGKAVGGKR
jgi:cell division protein FtsL